MGENYSGHVAANMTLQIGEKTYTVSPPKLKDLVELVRFMKDRAIERTDRNLALMKNAPTEVKYRLAEEAQLYARRIEIHTDEFAAEVANAEAFAYMLYILLKKNHPELTPDAVLTIVGDNWAVIDLRMADILSLALGRNPTNAAGQ